VANIGRKFEYWFNHRDESNLNAAALARATYLGEAEEVPTESKFRRAKPRSSAGLVGGMITM
jgi:hypothetical protein